MNTFKVMTQSEMETVNGGMTYLPTIFFKMMCYFIKNTNNHGRCTPRDSRYEYNDATRVAPPVRASKSVRPTQ